MKKLGLMLFVGLFLVVPFMLLQILVMSELNELKNTYKNADYISQSVVNKQ